MFRLVTAAFVLAVAALLVRYLFLRPRPDAAATAHARADATSEPVRIVSVHLALLENPLARRALLLGDAAAGYRAAFEHAGVTCDTVVGREAYDLVLFAGKGEPDRAAVLRRLGPAGAYVRCVDARHLDAAGFRKILTANPDTNACVRVWMPGVQDWLVVENRSPVLPRLSALMERGFADEARRDMAEAECDAVPWLFASYAGTRAELMPAFASKLDGPVLAQWFVTREVPPFDGFDLSDLDEDIRAKALADMRSAQVVRRLVLAGDIASASGDGAKATEAWARAAKRNPHDPMLLDRLVRLRVNAEVFEQMGRLPMAVTCYETMLRIRPTDRAALRCLAKCRVRLPSAKPAKPKEGPWR